MQNRFTLSPVPSSLLLSSPSLLESFRCHIEDNSTFLDRLSVIPSGDRCVGELNLENYREVLIGHFEENPVVELWEGEGKRRRRVKFTVRARRATEEESKYLLSSCPSNGKEGEGERLGLDWNGIKIHIPGKEGGTGSELWRGGILLSRMIPEICDAFLKPLPSGGRRRRVIELGAGCCGLPSITLWKLVRERGREDLEIVVSDGVDEIVESLEKMVEENCNEGRGEGGTGGRGRGTNRPIVRRVDWGELGEGDDKNRDRERDAYDVVMFSDCVYSDQCASLLLNAVSYFCRPGGVVVGVFGPMRVGVGVFMEGMEKTGRWGREERDVQGVMGGRGREMIRCNGGSGKGSRILFWKCNEG